MTSFPTPPRAQAAKRGRPKAFNDKTEQNTVQSLDRAMRVLHQISASDGVTLTELASLTAQSPATIYRILITLQAHQMVEINPDGQLWHIGPGTFRAGSAFLRRTNVVERARGPMQDLMRATGETANLGIEQADEVLFLSQVETHEAIRAFFPPGTRSPMHVSGIGKALLAWLDDAYVSRLVARKGLAGFTPASITTEQALMADRAATRARGYALDNEERAPGMRCIAAPIFNAHAEPIAGLSVSGPVFRLAPAATAHIGVLVAEAAAQVTRATGGTAPDR